MSTKLEVEKLLAFEKNLDVSRYRSFEIEIWPWVRYMVLKAFIDRLKGNPVQNFRWSNANPSTFKSQYANRRIKFINNRIYKRNRKQLDLKPTPIVFFGSMDHYYDKVDGKDYDRFIDPLIELIKNEYDLIKVHTTKGQEVQLDLKNTGVFIDESSLLAVYNSKMNLEFKNELKQLRNDLVYITELLGLEIDIEYAIHHWGHLLAYKQFFLDLFSKIKPVVVFSVSYYSIQHFGLNLACRELGITSVDIQHGKNGRYNHMMSHFSRFPNSGYQLLPDYFWTWGKSFSNDIKAHYPEGFELHKPLVGGNAWLAKWKSEDFYSFTQKQQALVDEMKTKRVILFSMQPGNEADVIPDWLYDIIKSARNCLWLLRGHPTQQLNKIDFKKCDQLPNVHIDLATSLPLFQILKHTDVNITQWSSVCIECLEFGVPSIIIHQEGKEIYEEELINGYFHYSEAPKEIIQLVNSLGKVENGNKIIADPTIIKDNLRRIVQPIMDSRGSIYKGK